ncbi:ParA family protein (plasmid) [Fusobacteria bacterium ZRK30]|nr:ParA family protein [Fusobacteria bacterium ZRK30]
MIIYIKNYKGGVGKSTITKNLASGLEKSNLKTAIVTFDAQNDSLAMFGHDWEASNGFKHFVKTNNDCSIHIRPNIHYYPLETDVFGANLKGKIKKAFEYLRTTYQVILIDGAPAVDGVLDSVALEISNKIIVPIMLDKSSVNGLARFLETEAGQKVNLIAPNFYGGTKVNKAYYKALEDFTKDSSVTLLNPIKRTALEEELSEKGKTIFETEDKRSFETRDRYIEMIEVIFND